MGKQMQVQLYKTYGAPCPVLRNINKANDIHILLLLLEVLTCIQQNVSQTCSCCQQTFTDTIRHYACSIYRFIQLYIEWDITNEEKQLHILMARKPKCMFNHFLKLTQ